VELYKKLNVYFFIQPKYITGLMKAADTRKKEHERRLEKTVQKEREEEKGKYDDKESFVTGAYKKKMEEMKLEEEKERQKQLLEGKTSRISLYLPTNLILKLEHCIFQTVKEGCR